MSNQPSTSEAYNQNLQSTSKTWNRSKKGQFLKKSSTKANSNGSSFRPCPASESDDSDYKEEAQPPKNKKIKTVTDKQARCQKMKNNLDKNKRAQWNAAEALQAARDQERTAKRERPLNRYILERPPPPSVSESDEKPTVPPPLTEKQLATRLAFNQERRRLCAEKKAKREQMLARKRERERQRRLLPTPDPGLGSIRCCPSTRATDHSGRTTVWMLRKFVIWHDEEKRRKYDAKRTKKRTRPLKPRTGPAANNGLYAIESCREMERNSENGFSSIQRIRKKENSNDLSDDEETKPRNHSGAAVKILEEEFKNVQYLDVKTIKKLVRVTKLKPKQITGWFANNRRKVQQKFRNGKIAVLPRQMKALERKNKEREERGEHLKMRDPEPSDEEDESEDGEEDQDGEDLEGGPEADEEDPFDITGYPVWPGLLNG